MNRLRWLMLCTLLLVAGCRQESGQIPVEDASSGPIAAVEQEQERGQQQEEEPQEVQVELVALPEQRGEEATATAEAAPRTGVVKRVVLDSPERGVLQISWSAAEPAPTDYWVSWARTGRDYPRPTTKLGNAYLRERSHTIRGLIPGARYKVRVRTRYRAQSDPDSIFLGAWSRTTTARIINPPSAPTGLRAEATHQGVILEWNNSREDSISGYLLVRELRNTVVLKRIQLDGAQSSYLDVSTDLDAPYEYYLHSINRDGQSPQSASVLVRTLAAIPGREYLYERIQPPMAPARANWNWGPGKSRFQELIVDFTIHNDPGNWSNQHGYFLILMQGYLSTWPFYFGLQTNVHDDRGEKAALFSRWGTRDLSLARFDPDEGWTQSSGHEGDFIGVRRSYEWGVGDYRARIAKDGQDSDGAWFSVWLTDLNANVTTWIGALKFPLHRGSADLPPLEGATIELYGTSPTRPIDTPFWHVSVNRPIGDGASPLGLVTAYPYDASPNALFNSNVRYDPEEDEVHLTIGGITERQDPAARYALK